MKTKLIRKEYQKGYSNKRGNVYLAKCFRCKHEWIPRVEIIKTCPNCRSPYWDKARNKQEYRKMGIWARLIVQNSKYRQFTGKAIDEKCVDGGKQAKHWKHRNYCRPLLVEAICESCNSKRGQSINYVESKTRLDI